MSDILTEKMAELSELAVTESLVTIGFNVLAMKKSNNDCAKANAALAIEIGRLTAELAAAKAELEAKATPTPVANAPERPPTIIPIWVQYANISFNYFYNSESRIISIPSHYAPVFDYLRGVVIRTSMWHDPGMTAAEVLKIALEGDRIKERGEPGNGFRTLKGGAL